MGGSVSMIDGHIDGDELTPYKKKAKKNTPAKAKHKHVFVPCVLEFEIMVFDKERGQVPVQKSRIAAYCPMCGKLGETDFRKWYTWVSTSPGFGRSELTPEAEREMCRKTRTLPTFHVKDGYFAKFVELEEV